VLWLRDMRNDLQEPAIEAEPVIGQLLEVLERKLIRAVD
jgi:4-diphosphocytidyl-2-C-methyl-D-erythritol kinase